MKRILIILIIIFAHNIVRGQTIDTSYLVCTYKYTFVNDTTKTSVSSKYNIMTLQIGYNTSKYYSKQFRYAMNEIKNGRKDIVDLGITYTIYRNYPQINTTTLTDRILIDKFYYEEPTPSQQWKITEEIKEMHGYKCQKAVCTFRGRNYNAWFTKEIAVSEGPYKFRGLPGLIVYISDVKNHYTFELISVETKKEPITFDKMKNSIKVTREDYNKVLKRYQSDFFNYMRDRAGIIMHGAPEYLNNKLWKCDIIERK